MQIKHIGILTVNLEKMKDFYTRYFSCLPNNKYINESKGFESYFLDFYNSCQIELMHLKSVTALSYYSAKQTPGLHHIAISVGSKDKVDELTEILRKDGYQIISEPRITGDGYYESCALDPENNRVEITE